MRCEVTTHDGKVYDFEGTEEELLEDVQELGGPEAVKSITVTEPDPEPEPVTRDNEVPYIDF